MQRILAWRENFDAAAPAPSKCTYANADADAEADTEWTSSRALKRSRRTLSSTPSVALSSSFARSHSHSHSALSLSRSASSLSRPSLRHPAPLLRTTSSPTALSLRLASYTYACPACDRVFVSQRAFWAHAGAGVGVGGEEGEDTGIRVACGAAVAYAFEEAWSVQ
ncbi:hypothetical protein B0H10DRAFT_2068698 [Mycena sp. CBHHK59/15]|nr:hypothetical protein B0H10DRAFT_2068698 [Mycena sp. CBHHK59/15]